MIAPGAATPATGGSGAIRPFRFSGRAPVRLAAVLSVGLLMGLDTPGRGAGSAAAGDAAPARANDLAARAGELSASLGVFRVEERAKELCPERLNELEGELARLAEQRRAAGRRADALAAVAEGQERFPSRLEAARESCRRRIHTEVLAARGELATLAATAREARRRGQLPDAGELADALAAADTILGTPSELVAGSLLLAERGRVTEAWNRLRALVRDPCEGELQRAEMLMASERRETALRIYCQIMVGRCVGDQALRAAGEALDRVEREADLTGEIRCAPGWLEAAVRSAAPPPGASAGSRERAVAVDQPATEPLAVAAEGSSATGPHAILHPSPARGAGPDASPNPNPGLALDIWQSAWGDFSDLRALGGYLARNGLREVNLNPGFEMSRSFRPEGRRRLAAIVHVLRELGVERINFLYAELGYDIEEYAVFLRENGDLGIDLLLDDSEFVDASKGLFVENHAKVKRQGLRYGAFVTLETVGNSGVSDATRRWALEHLDVPILMSYFDCTLDGQKDWLTPYLEHADSLGRQRDVRVAILMGRKKVGRERSCEQALPAGELQRFLAELHAWASERHPSYGGLVLETNLKLPEYDIAAQP